MHEGVRGQLADDKLDIIGEVRQIVIGEVSQDEVSSLRRATDGHG